MSLTDRILTLIDEGLAAAPGYEPELDFDFGPPRIETQRHASISWTHTPTGRRFVVPVPRGTWVQPIIDGRLVPIRLGAEPYIVMRSASTGRNVVFHARGRVPAKKLR